MTEVAVWPVVSGFLLGLMGSGHCLGMCSGMSVVIHASVEPERRLRMVLLHQLFRLLSYALLGLLAATLGQVFERWTQFPLLPLLGALLMVMLGLYLLRQWNVLVYLERAGHRWWQLLQPLRARLMPINSWPKAMLIGLLWGFLPCGLVYSALVLAAAAGSPAAGFATMLAFGAGTLPMILSIGWFGQRVWGKVNRSSLQTVLGVVFLLWGGWQLTQLWPGLAHAHPDGIVLGLDCQH